MSSVFVVAVVFAFVVKSLSLPFGNVVYFRKPLKNHAEAT
jgi:hypothetical protein